MGGIGKWTITAGLALAVLLIAGLGLYISHTQDQTRASVRDNLERRAALTGRLVGGALTANGSAEAAAQYSGSPRELRREIGPDEDEGRRTMVLDARGRVLASSPAALADDRRLLRRNPHLRAALAGRLALSEAFRDDEGRWLIEVAVPFRSRSGRRVLARSAPVEVVHEFASGFFATASALPGSRGFLLDGTGRVLSSTVAPRGGVAEPEPRLAAALERGASGSYGERTFVSAPVPASRWRVVLSVPSDKLYAEVDGPAARRVAALRGVRVRRLRAARPRRRRHAGRAPAGPVA